MTGRSATHETWRNVPGFGCAYIVSDRGRVRNINTGKCLFGDTDRKGYRRVNLGGKHRRVARLVCGAFNGSCPDGHVCAHLDGNNQNDRADNLAWVTPSENVRHSIAHGTHRHPNAKAGSGHHSAKLTDARVREMREKAGAGQSERSLAAEYGISPVQTHRIITRENWRHV